MTDLTELRRLHEATIRETNKDDAMSETENRFFRASAGIPDQLEAVIADALAMSESRINVLSRDKQVAEKVAHAIRQWLPSPGEGATELIADCEEIRAWINGIEHGVWNPTQATKRSLVATLTALLDVAEAGSEWREASAELYHGTDDGGPTAEAELRLQAAERALRAALAHIEGSEPS